MCSHCSISMGTVLFLVALLFTPCSVDSTSAIEEPHDFIQFDRKCDWCHISVGIKNRGIMRKTAGQICAECHKLNDTMHPVEMAPAMEIPADLPLDNMGLLTCATCHNIHRSRFAPLTGEKTMYLRRDGSARAFCESCHRNGIRRAGDGAAGE